MKEGAKSFTNGLMESVTLYWNKFLLALPRIVMAIILLVIVFYVASYIARLLKKKLSGEEHDPLFVSFISKITKVAVIICGLILALQTLGLTGVAGGLRPLCGAVFRACWGACTAGAGGGGGGYARIRWGAGHRRDRQTGESWPRQRGIAARAPGALAGAGSTR